MTGRQERKHAGYLLRNSSWYVSEGQYLQRFGKHHLLPEHCFTDSLTNMVAGAIFIIGRVLIREGLEARKRGRFVLMRQEWSMSGKSDLVSIG